MSGNEQYKNHFNKIKERNLRIIKSQINILINKNLFEEPSVANENRNEAEY